ncbi:hypothetical protein LguiB_035005 [Lonicera macranthoides]
MPNVLSPGKTLGFTEMAERPVSEKFPGNLIPEKMKSSGVTSVEFLHGMTLNSAVLMVADFVVGMQKS